MKWLRNLFKKKKKVVAAPVKPVVPTAPPPAVEQPQPPKKEEEKKTAPPWYLTMLSWKGKGEHDKSFVSFMSGFWKYVKLPGFKTIVGSKYAWCGLGAAAALIVNEMAYQPDGAGAKNWDKYGQKIEWKSEGVPQGAILRLNHQGDCSSSKGNHVTFANGDCTAADLLKKGATIDGLGANQADKVKVSTYPVYEICSVRWPPNVQLPPKVIKSVNCTSNNKSGESTQ